MKHPIQLKRRTSNEPKAKQRPKYEKLAATSAAAVVAALLGA